MRKTLASISLALLLSACASGSGTAPATSTPAVANEFRPPQVMRGSGVDSVIGEGADALASRFGTARIDLEEGDARKLQFAAATCVLDIYLYPLAANAAPVATYIEARERQGGGEADRAICIDQMEQATGQ